MGFVRHQDKVGLTCAACHTGEINYKGTAMRVDGAPSSMDFIGWSHELLNAERREEARAATAPGTGDEAARVAAARATLSTTQSWWQGYFDANKPGTVEGFGRLDAVGRIVNQVIRFTSALENSVPPNAPNDFPCLWDAPRHDFVQWTAFAPNSSAGSVGRNTGEVVGVFGNVEVKHYDTEEETKKGYPLLNVAREALGPRRRRRRRAPRGGSAADQNITWLAVPCRAVKV